MKQRDEKPNAFVPGVIFGLFLGYIMRYARRHKTQRKIIDATYDLQKHGEKT